MPSHVVVDAVVVVVVVVFVVVVVVAVDIVDSYSYGSNWCCR